MIRWQENCQPTPGNAAPDGWQRFRYIVIPSLGETWITFGAEYRVRVEAIDKPTYGLTPAPGYTALDQRFLLHADLRHSSGLRFFVQISAAASTGRALRPFDRSHPDLQQIFLDVPLGRHGFLLRVGRQEFDADGVRLIALRDAANLRRSFDTAQLDWGRHRDRVTAFWARPVLNLPHAFDDRHTPGESFGGIILRRGWEQRSSRRTLAVYLLERRRARAFYQDARGREHRETYALRATADSLHYAMNLTATLQTGHITAARIRAGGFAGEAFWKASLRRAPLRIGATFSFASGDTHPGDRVLNTFDPLYPNLGYFTDAPVIFPGNDWDVHPQIECKLWRRWDLIAGVDLLSRVTTHDAVYQNGVPLLPGNGHGGLFLGALWNGKATWTLNAHVAVTAAAVRAQSSNLTATAGARGFNYGLLQTAFRY